MFETGDRVRIDGDHGYYWVKKVRANGQIDVWGGDADPNKIRRYRTVTPDALGPDTRKLERKSYPGFAK